MAGYRGGYCVSVIISGQLDYLDTNNLFLNSSYKFTFHALRFTFYSNPRSPQDQPDDQRVERLPGDRAVDSPA